VARLGLLGARVIGVHTDGNAEAVRRLLHPRSPVSVIPHGVRPRRRDNPPAAGLPRFVFFGVYRPNKGLDVLVEALQAVEGARLTVAGLVPDADIPCVAALLAPLGDRVSWDRRLVPDGELDQVFDGATAVVLPYREFEAQSGVLHLAVEMAVPVVVSEAGGLAELTRAHGIGEVTSGPGTEALASALRRVAEPAHNAVLRRRVVEAQDQLSWETSACGWWAALEPPDGRSA
jgi:glycosyltransferase involved in cell wall biosynthesis